MPLPFPNMPLEQRGHVHSLRHDSNALLGNPWSDPSVRELIVYTPPGFSAGGKALPVVFFLPGFGSTGESLLGRTLSGTGLFRRIDRWIAERGCPPFIAVLPDCMTTLVGSQYIDSQGIGCYGTYLADELVPFVHSRFHTSGSTAFVGRSSGGFGAIRLAMDFPHAVDAVACHAGDMGFATGYSADLSASIGPVRAAGGPMAFVSSFWEKQHLTGPEFSAMNLLCMSAAYDPDPEALGFPGRIPVDFETGEIDFGSFLGWGRHDPIELASDPICQEALRSLRLLFIDAGDRDEYHLHLAARRFCARLDEHSVPHVYEEFPGGHRGTSWRYRESVPRLVRAMAEGS
jgi:enterochelin esterase-like enzyme